MKHFTILNYPYSTTEGANMHLQNFNVVLCLASLAYIIAMSCHGFTFLVILSFMT